MEALLNYPFPGNIRELEHEIERVVTIAPDQEIIQIDLLSDHVRQRDELLTLAMNEKGNLKQTIEKVERHMIEESLKALRGNKSRVARELGLSRVGLQKKMKRYGINC